MSSYVLLYEPADDVTTKAPAHFPPHRARWQTFRDAGEAAREFAEGDPFMLEGFVARREIREWKGAATG